MRKEIKYIGFYDIPDSKYKRVNSIAATSKMDYICDAIIEAGFNVHIISPSWFDYNNSKVPFLLKSKIQINENKKITFCPSIGTKMKVLRNFKIIITLLWLFFWLLCNTKRNEKILIYHSPWLAIPINWAKKLKRYKLVLEVEEIYGDVSSINNYFNKLEQKLIHNADAYLLSTELLIQRIGNQKPFIVIYGIYRKYEQLSIPINDGKIHLLYAGIIDLYKAGAFNAVEAARYLPDNYFMHIIGFGEVDLLMEKIKEINSGKGCQIIYDGILSGNEFIMYCQKCHIGLSTQKMDGKYLSSSFPSKILSYLALGLKVASCYVECVANSKINENVRYYKNDNPESIAEAIRSINIHDDENSSILIENLEIEFIKQFKILFV